MTPHYVTIHQVHHMTILCYTIYIDVHYIIYLRHYSTRMTLLVGKVCTSHVQALEFGKVRSRICNEAETHEGSRSNSWGKTEKLTAKKRESHGEKERNPWKEMERNSWRKKEKLMETWKELPGERGRNSWRKRQNAWRKRENFVDKRATAGEGASPVQRALPHTELQREEGTLDESLSMEAISHSRAQSETQHTLHDDRHAEPGEVRDRTCTALQGCGWCRRSSPGGRRASRPWLRTSG